MVFDDVFVLFLDVLGFSALVRHNPPEEIRKIYDSEIRQTLGISPLLAGGHFGNSFGSAVVTSHNGKLIDTKQNRINLHIMSDTAIAWTNDSSLDSFTKIAEVAATYLATSFILGLPHRGGLSRGNMQLIALPLNGTLQNNLVGTGIVRAHDLESKTDWMGCVVDPEAIAHFDQDGITRLLQRQKCPVAKYQAPFKHDPLSTLVINWPICAVGVEGNLAFFQQQFGRCKKRIPESVNRKIQNTFEFYSAMTSGI